MLRGGSWINNNQNNARCAYRNRNNPNNRNNNRGCRLLVSHILSCRQCYGLARWLKTDVSGCVAEAKNGAACRFPGAKGGPFSGAKAQGDAWPVRILAPGKYKKATLPLVTVALCESLQREGWSVAFTLRGLA